MATKVRKAAVSEDITNVLHLTLTDVLTDTFSPLTYAHDRTHPVVELRDKYLALAIVIPYPLSSHKSFRAWEIVDICDSNSLIRSLSSYLAK